MTAQLSLPLSRTDDPETSRDAARRAQSGRVGLRKLILAELAHRHGAGVGPCPTCGSDDWFTRPDRKSRECRPCNRRITRAARQRAKATSA